MLESRKMTQQIDWWAKQPSRSHVACISEDLKCCHAWDITCRHKAKDITPSIASRRGTERSAWWSSSEGWKRAIISKTNTQTVSKAMLGGTSERWGGAHTGFPEHAGTLLNWTEQKWRHSSKPVARLQSWQMTEYHLLTQREQEIILCLQTGHKKLKQNVWKLWLAPKQPIPLLRSRAGNSRTHPAGLPKPQVAEGGLLERQHSLHCNCVKQPRRPKD